MAKIIRISAIPVLLLLLSTLLFGCAAKIEAKTVYESILDYAKSDNNIFQVNQVGEDNPDYIISVNIGYTDTINTKLLEEQSNAKSDFYLLKDIYEPTLNFSLYFFLKNTKFLQTSNKSIDKEDAGLVYDKFNKLKKSIESFQTALANLNYYESAFASDTYKDKKGMVYKQFDDFKVKYGALINSCFELNNEFIKTYYTVYKPTDYRVETEKDLDGLYAQMLCSEVAAKLSYIGFLVDGVKCNLSNTNKSSFEIENEPGDKSHTYTKHLSKISETTKSLINISSDKFQTLNGNNNIKSFVIVLQNLLEIFDSQTDNFISALNKINYKDYVASGKTLAEYSSTLRSNEKSYLYIVEDFLDTTYTNLSDEIEFIIGEINK